MNCKRQSAISDLTTNTTLVDSASTVVGRRALLREPVGPAIANATELGRHFDAGSQQTARKAKQVSLLTLIRSRPSRIAGRTHPHHRPRPRPRRRDLETGAPAKCGTRNAECRMPGGDCSHVANRSAQRALPLPKRRSARPHAK